MVSRLSFAPPARPKHGQDVPLPALPAPREPLFVDLTRRIGAKNLGRVREALRSCRVDDFDALVRGFELRRFLDSVCAVSKLTVGRVRVYVLLTHTQAFVLTGRLAEELCDLDRAFLDVLLEERVMLSLLGRRLYLYRIAVPELEKLCSQAARARRLRISS
jgi:hypothetical protein